MAVRVTYHCPSCGSDLNSQYWLPAARYVTMCKGCGNSVVRSGASIRDDWKWTFVFYGMLPLWAILCFMPAFAKESVGSRIFLAFMATLLFGLVALSILGWIVGVFVSVFCSRQPRKRGFDPPRS